MIASLLQSRRFLPLLLTHTLGMFNDSVFKNAMAILIVFQASQSGAAMTVLSGAIFILPFALFSALAGQAADRLDKARLIIASKIAEVVFMVLAAWALTAESLPGLLVVLFWLGVQATVYSPLKYAILPQHLTESELLSGLALLEAGSFTSILTGTILGGLLIGVADGPASVAAACLVVAVLGLAAALFVPAAPSQAPDLRINWNVVSATWAMVRTARANPPVWQGVRGTSWFWTLGGIYLSLFPVLVRDVFHGDNHVVTLLLLGFALGVGVGSLATPRLLKGSLSLRFVPWASLAISLLTFGFALLCTAPSASAWQTPAAMLGSLPGALAWLCLLAAAAAGGVFILPLYANVQHRAAPSQRARMASVNCVTDAVFMVSAAVAVALLATAGLGPGMILALAGALNLIVAWRFATTLPAPAAALATS